MGSLEDSETTAKLADSAYSNSCSNSQSRRSDSSKSTRSGSHSSGSSGYGGIILSGSNGSDQPCEKRSKDKHGKKKRANKTGPLSDETTVAVETMAEELGQMETVADQQATKPEDDATPPPEQMESKLEIMDLVAFNPATNGEANFEITTNGPHQVANQIVPTTSIGQYWSTLGCSAESFSCVISMHDSVVIYTTGNITGMLGYSKDMWVGRSFIDFVHPEDRKTFASQIMSGVTIPKNTQAQRRNTTVVSMCCRVRNYRTLGEFGNSKTTYKPFELKLSFKHVLQEEGMTVYLVLQATQLITAFKEPNELVYRAKPFITRHSANGTMEYVDPESVPFLGYLPQDLVDKDALLMYHPEDLLYIQTVYEAVVRDGNAPKTRAYRLLAQNGGYLKLETEFSCFVNPWSKELEFVSGKHYIIEGPPNPDVFAEPAEEHRTINTTEEMSMKPQELRDAIASIMTEASSRNLESARQRTSTRCLLLASVMETLSEEPARPGATEELRLEIQDTENSCYERDSVMLGGISPHHENESKTSTETLLSYNQLNYNETLQRYFDSYQPAGHEHRDDDTSENADDMSNPDYNFSVNDSNAKAKPNSSNSDTDSFSESDMLYQRLSEDTIVKHNTNMEKYLVGKKRELHHNSKGTRENIIMENRQKKKDHLARCNAPYQPTAAKDLSPQEPHGVKRPFTDAEPEPSSSKQHCHGADMNRHKCESGHVTNDTMEWTTPQATCADTFVRDALQVPLVSTVAAAPGMYSLYYLPTAEPSVPMHSVYPSTSSGATTLYQPNPGISTECNVSAAVAPMPYVLLPPVVPAMFGPFVYTPPDARAQMPPWMEPPPLAAAATPHLAQSLTNDNYEEQVCTPFMPSAPPTERRRCVRSDSAQQGSAVSSSGFSSNNRVSGSSMEMSDSSLITPNKVYRGMSVAEKDLESSSSFSSSFFYTESGSTSESDNKNKMGPPPPAQNPYPKQVGWQVQQKALQQTSFTQYRDGAKNLTPLSIALHQAISSTDVMYNYQMHTKNKSAVLEEDKKKINDIEQPPLVDEQLSQLYLDLQLERAPVHLTLAEGLTSSGSSGEESAGAVRAASKITRRKRVYCRLGMIYEEEAPLPPPAVGDTAPAPLQPEGPNAANVDSE